VLILTPALPVLAVDDPRFVRVEPETLFSHPLGDGSEHLLGLPPTHTMHDSIVGSCRVSNYAEDWPNLQ
jgi:hypothetical protein